MAAETMAQSQVQQDRQTRRRPFSSWMKKLTSFKSTAETNATPTTKNGTRVQQKKQSLSKNNNPYPQSGRVNEKSAQDRPDSPVPTGGTYSSSSLNRRRTSIRSSEDGHPPPTIGNKSIVATINTDVAHSDAAPSHAPSSGQQTAHTMGASNGRGVDSTFSSPAPSVRSITTTLTTIHSAAPATQSQTTNTHNGAQAIHFSHQFPTSPLPSAIPPHLAPLTSGGHPSTYNTATANNLLSDNASILTLASSSKRRRRRSMDTDASVRALAPSSVFGGSRESLPLSILSANIEPIGASSSTHHQSRPSGALNERASIYNSAGAAPALSSDRNSYYAGKSAHIPDGGSVKSGYMGHGRNNSVSGSIGGLGAASPLASPRDAVPNTGTLSRSNSNWTAEFDADKGDHEPSAEHKKENTK